MDTLMCEKVKQWAEIPDDISSLIYDQLNWRDRIRFLSTCKNWKALQKPIFAHPLALKYVSSILYCSFIGPDYRIILKDSTGNTNKTRLLEEFGSEFFQADIIASKRGWLLVKNCINPTSFFCYNPFSSTVITLPNLDARRNDPCAAFSGSPISPHSVIFLAGFTFEDCGFKVFVISLYFYGQTTWKDYSFRTSDNLICGDVVYSKGKLYCVFDNGAVGLFNMENQGWSMVVSPVSFFTNSRLRYHMAECGGEIFLVCHQNDSLHFNLFRLDGKELNWIKVDKLGDGAIFLNHRFSSISTITTKGSDSEFKNKLFYISKGFPFFTWSFSFDLGYHSMPCSFNNVGSWFSKYAWIDPP